MATNTSILGLSKPAYTDDADVAVINSNMDLIDAESGRLRANFAGTYANNQAYAVGAYCIYQGNLYRCTTAIGSGGENWTSGHWTQVAVGTELSSLNDHIVSMFKRYSYNGTPDANGYITTDIPLSTYIPIAAYNSNRDGWTFTFVRDSNKSSTYWVLYIRGATASSGTFSGNIVAIKVSDVAI